MKIHIIGTGLSGLVGTRVIELLKDKYDFTDLSLSTGVDITDYDQVLKVFEKTESSVVLHMAAKTDVDSCEDDKILGEDGMSWMVNVVGTGNIADAAKKTNKRVIYISTDFVFDGTKDYYEESDMPNPVNWYGITKFEGEQLIINSGISYSIVRLSYPYRSNFKDKTDFVRRIIEKTNRNEDIYSLTDHIFTPTFIDDIALALDTFLSKEIGGIYHAVGSESLTPFIAVEKIFDIFGLKGNIKPVIREIYFKDRAFRPCRLFLKNDRISKLGVKMSGFSEGLHSVKKQMTG